MAASALLAQDDQEEAIFELSPFTVEGSEDAGYRATSTLAGSRLRTNLSDVGSAISVVTEQFLEDTGATDNQSLLVYTTNTEVGGAYGNFTGAGDGATPVESFASPSQNTRVRGLAAADNTRGYFLSEVPWDGYNVNRVDMQRGPNAILFGLGSPAGIINATLDEASFSDEAEVELRFGRFGSTRMSLNANKVVLEDELAVRVAALKDDEKFRQKPAFEDDERLYLAFKYQPGFLNSEAVSTDLKGSYEGGSIKSNRPRTITPMDRITPFFRDVGVVANEDGTYSYPLYPGAGGKLYDPYGIRDTSGELGLGEMHKTIGGELNPHFVPALGNYGKNFGGALTVFGNADSSEITMIMAHEPKPIGGIAPDGSIDQSLSLPFGRLSSIGTYTDYAAYAELPLAEAGLYKNIYLQDPTIFDFYNNLIDGPNKEEESDFDAVNLSLSQTFLDKSVGYELAYFKQDYNRRNVSLISDGSRVAISIDTNSTLGDGSPNPNAGRPFIADSAQGGNNIYESDRESLRFTAFGEYDFQRSGSEGWFARLLGRHVLTGLYAEDERETDSLNFQRWITGPENADELLWEGWEGSGRDSNEIAVNTFHYLGESLLGRSSASGAYIPRISAKQVPAPGMYYSFDATWNAPDVDPAAPWGDSTQSENPANYVGWTDRPYYVYDALEGDNMYQYGMATGGGLSRQKVESQALIWQGYLWDQALVGMYGWREDKDNSWNLNSTNFQEPVTKVFDFRHPDYNLDFDPGVESGESQSWSVALHLNRLLKDRLPFNVSLYHNESENFQPGAGRVNIYNEILDSPSGSTVDQSVLLATKDNRYTLRVTKYETKVTSATAGDIGGSWWLGAQVSAGTLWANRYEHNLTSGYVLGLPRENDPEYAWLWDYPEGPEFEAAAIASWREFTSQIPQKFLDAWGIEGDIVNDVALFSASAPANMAFTQDAISKGYEFEFTANPTQNWRISMNASKTEAIRNNVGGEAVREFVELADKYLLHSPAGDIRLWGAGSAVSMRREWNNLFRSNYALTKLLEGTNNPEIREWHVNLVTNYDFKDGPLGGLNIGGSYRWADNVVIGYPARPTEDGYEYDLANPYRGPSEDNVDLWIGYSMDLTDAVGWRVQLNVRDVFADKDLIPINTQPNGDWAAVRIPGSTNWMLTNTFTF